MTVSRAAIAAALSSVPGVTGSTFEPPSKAAGQGWPVWRSTDITPTGGAGCHVGSTHWYVYVVLPGGNASTPADAADPLVTPIAEALAATSLTLELVEPYSLVLGPDNTIPVLRYTATD